MSDEEKEEVLSQVRIALRALEVAQSKDTIALSERIEREFANTQRALEIQTRIYDERLSGLNNLEHQKAEELNRIQKEYVQLSVYTPAHRAIESRLDELKEFKERTIGGHSVSIYISIVSVMIATITAVIEYFGK